MKKSIVMSGVLSLLFLTTISLRATQQPSPSDTMKHDSMGQGDAMAKDKMSNEMAKAEVIKGWVTDSECARGRQKVRE